MSTPYASCVTNWADSPRTIWTDSERSLPHLGAGVEFACDSTAASTRDGGVRKLTSGGSSSKRLCDVSAVDRALGKLHMLLTDEFSPETCDTIDDILRAVVFGPWDVSHAVGMQALGQRLAEHLEAGSMPGSQQGEEVSKHIHVSDMNHEVIEPQGPRIGELFYSRFVAPPFWMHIVGVILSVISSATYFVPPVNGVAYPACIPLCLVSLPYAIWVISEFDVPIVLRAVRSFDAWVLIINITVWSLLAIMEAHYNQTAHVHSVNATIAYVHLWIWAIGLAFVDASQHPLFLRQGLALGWIFAIGGALLTRTVLASSWQTLPPIQIRGCFTSDTIIRSALVNAAVFVTKYMVNLLRDEAVAVHGPVKLLHRRSKFRHTGRLDAVAVAVLPLDRARKKNTEAVRRADSSIIRVVCGRSAPSDS
eukprot:TRINITY_DN28929_c0_g1_i1.p1 TRINITY_DN28929_c0_g1~~TRINITY_DN28929_c0_g1_i1.p1  ORF type:complete len:421 (+),score=16.47 TRINITY_DN28929_c0_g1_i1:55-1317(+)